jgi:histidyl-tRNA synthetase
LEILNLKSTRTVLFLRAKAFKMASQAPSIPKGTRDFSPVEVNRREYIFKILKEVFRLHGYQPIETPAMENLSTLLGKYGEEGDKLLFKILNSGDFTRNENTASWTQSDSNAIAARISEKGLRYDLTVPFARFVVQHQNDITFPFRRYQIQPVWRADRPQKGRYREFFQCDADVIGSESLMNETELIQIIDEAFIRLDLKVMVKLNNRKILTGIAEITGQSDKIVEITVAIDKLDKIGLDKVNEELEASGVPADAIKKLSPLLTYQGGNEEKLHFLRSFLTDSATGTRGIEELEEVIQSVQARGIKANIEFDMSLARGLNYYTGIIIEVKSTETSIGSICGGGRYDNLTGIFGLQGISGVGVSFGADRIYDVMLELNKFSEISLASTSLLFVNFGKSEVALASELATEMRSSGISCEIYPDAVKLKKQFQYADDLKIPFVAIIGDEELKMNMVTVKSMKSGEQLKLETTRLAEYLLSKSGE